VSDFLSIANELSGTKPKATGFGAIANDLGLPAQPKQGGTKQGAPAFEFEDAAAFRKKLEKSGDPALLAEFDKQYTTVAPKAQPQARPQGAPPPGYEPGGQPTPSNPNGWQPIQGPAETIGDKIVGGGEAALNAVTGAVGGTLGGIGGAAKALVRKTGYALGGIPETPDLEGNNFIQRGFDSGAQALTYQPRTEAGQRYVDKAVAPAMQTLMAAAPVMHTATIGSPMAKQAIGDRLGAAADRSPSAARAAFDASKRVEPTMGEAKLTPQQIEAQAAPQAFTPPTIKNASPELQAAVKKAEGNGQVNAQVLARHVDAETLPVPVKLTEGQASLDPVLISQEMNGRGKGKAAPVSPDFYKQQGQAIAQNMEAIRAKAAPDVPPTASLVDHGQTLLDSYKAMDEPVRADISAKYQALADANGGELPLSGQAFVSAADAALKKANRTRFVPAEVQGILGDLREGGPMTFADFETYRTILAEQARKADRAGDGTASYAVGLVREALESLPMEGEAAALKPLADAARGAAKARFDAIKSDPAYKAAISDAAGVGEPSALADKFFNAYVTKGARANVAQMRERLAANPIAAQTIAAGTLDQLAKQLKADQATGKFSQHGYNEGLKAIAPKLDSLLDAEAAHQAQALGRVAKAAQTDVRGAYVNSSNSATALMAEGVKTTAEHGTNWAFGGVPVGTVVRKAGGYASDALGASKAAKKATAPGAGLTKASGFPGIEPK
jgi:hypothetical protein